MLRTRRSRNLFFTSFLITLVSLFVIIAGGFVAWRSMVQPPVVGDADDIPGRPNPTPNPDDDTVPAFFYVEPHPEDALLESPFNLTAEGGWERKPNFFTFLVIGYDDGLNTDTIMVAAFDAAEQQAYIISIPRDTQVDVQRGIRKINAAYAAGRRNGGHEGGIDQMKREIQTLIGFLPDFYVSIDERAFVRVVDAVGGVNIDVPFHMHYRDPFQDLYINIPAGPQRLFGEDALGFVRFRYHYGRRSAISVHQRQEHQHQFLQALMQELLTPRVITSIPELIRVYRDDVSTCLSLTDQLWFGEQFVRGDIELHTYNFPVNSIRTTLWYDFPIHDEVIELINRTINPFTRDITLDMLRLMSP
ncbi:MAG: LCP family protein [Defluviitaleaceae bacterium]|nr:LCP family protein [Defluviitaleaceae bacterium]